jgi:hypothetical protein
LHSNPNPFTVNNLMTCGAVCESRLAVYAICIVPDKTDMDKILFSLSYQVRLLVIFSLLIILQSFSF